MPQIPKDWHNYPLTDTPINRAALVGLEARVGNYVGAVSTVGAGVDGFESFRVKQHGGGDMTVDVGLPSVVMGAYIALDSNGSIERYEYAGLQLNQPISAADATNPRVDQVVLVPGATDSQAPTTAVLVGTPTSGATLENRNGAAVLPVARLRLADVLVPASATTIPTANIRDRRPMGTQGATPMARSFNELIPLVDAAPLYPHPFSIVYAANFATSHTTYQVAAAVWLPRRIVATKIRWSYLQGATALTGNYNFAIFDASGVLVVATGSIAFAGAANSYNIRADGIASTVFEAGWYHVWIGLASLAGGTAGYYGTSTTQLNGNSPIPAQNIAYYRPASGIAVPNNFVAGVLQDVYTVGSTSPTPPGVPLIELAA